MQLTMSLQYDYDLPEVAHEDQSAETRTDIYQLQAKSDVKDLVSKSWACCFAYARLSLKSSPSTEDTTRQPRSIGPSGS